MSRSPAAVQAWDEAMWCSAAHRAAWLARHQAIAAMRAGWGRERATTAAYRYTLWGRAASHGCRFEAVLVVPEYDGWGGMYVVPQAAGKAKRKHLRVANG